MNQRYYVIVAVMAVAGFLWLIGGNVLIGSLIGAFLPRSINFFLRGIVELVGSYLIICAFVVALLVAHGGLRLLLRKS